MNPLLTLSVVSHGQGDLIRHLLRDLRAGDLSRVSIVLVINIPEPMAWLDEFTDLSIEIVRNNAPAGFGANHNHAFRHCSTPFFGIINPDIRVTGDPALALLDAFDERTGACGPLVLDSDGRPQDSARRAPTFARLFRRAVLRQREADYRPDHAGVAVDWLAGMFVVFRSEAFRAVDGFDEHFYMYMEDADIARRLWRAGWAVRLVPTVSVVHDAQRASHRSLRHLRWHARSVVRYLTGF